MSSLKKAVRIGFLNMLRLTSETANMLTEKNSLLEELALTKKRGFALDYEEFVAGTVAIAVPAFDSNKRFVGMFATHEPKSRMPYEHFWNIEIIADGSAQISNAVF